MNKIKELLTKKLTFIKYIISAGISFALDMILFSIISKILMLHMGDLAILVGTVIARIISSMVNYLMNKNAVFNTNDKKKIDKESFIKYYILVLVQMCISAGSVLVLYKILKVDQTIIKIPVDIAIFIANYFIQKVFIFKDKNIVCREED